MMDTDDTDDKDRKEMGKTWIDQKPPPDPGEAAQARELGEALDRVLAGEGPPPDDDLADLALMIRASAREQHLRPGQGNELVEQALGQVQHRRRISKLRRASPVLALAASLVLLVCALLLATVGSGPRFSSLPGPRPRALSVRSRSSDELMGRPFEDRAGASGRLDLVFADRLGGYRQLLLQGGDTP